MGNILNEKSYYAGGTLCIDTDEGCIAVNINGGTVGYLSHSDSTVPMTRSNWMQALLIYRVHKLSNTNKSRKYCDDCFEQFKNKFHTQDAT